MYDVYHIQLTTVLLRMKRRNARENSLPSSSTPYTSLNVKVHYKRRCPGHNDIGIFSRVKMATVDSVVPSRKRPRREGFRYQMELNFPLQEEKEQFLARIDRVKQSLISERRRSIDQLELLSCWI